jgi:hypothetical protein
MHAFIPHPLLASVSIAYVAVFVIWLVRKGSHQKRTQRRSGFDYSDGNAFREKW